MFFSAYANTGVPVEAAKFISYFVNDPAATEVLGVERGVPGVGGGARGADRNTLDELGKAQIEYIEGLGDLAGPLPPPPPAGAGEIAFALQAHQRGGRLRQPSPEEGGEALVSEATAILGPGLSRMAAPRAASASATRGRGRGRALRLARPGLGRERRGLHVPAALADRLPRC